MLGTIGTFIQRFQMGLTIGKLKCIYIHVRYNWNLYTEVSDGFNYRENQIYNIQRFQMGLTMGKTKSIKLEIYYSYTLETFRETCNDG